MKFNGKEYTTYTNAFGSQNYKSTYTSHRGAAPIPRRKNKITTIDEVISILQEGDYISYPHYYRTGDRGLQLVIEKLREHKKRDIRLYGNAYFDHCNPWLIEAIQDGIITELYGNPYRQIGAELMKGVLLPALSVGVSHGNRVRKLQTGEIKVKIAFGPVPIADIHGNANGMMGDPKHFCGPLGLFAADAEYADYVCLLASNISNKFIMPASISMEQTDFVVHVADVGLSEGIGSGTLNVEKAKSVAFNAIIAENVTNVMKAAQSIKEGFNFQVGSGAGLIVLENIKNMLHEMKIQAGFAIGGVNSMHVDMLDEGLLKYLMHGQLFEPSERVVKSLLENPYHQEITAGYYASVAGKECAVNMLDVAVLSALEIDTKFNANTVCANGRIIGGIGGGQDVAAGADMTIMFLPLATGKNGKGFPKVVDEVYTITTPGEVIDVIVTEEYVAINPTSKSKGIEALKNNAKDFGLTLISIDDLHEKSIKKAKTFGVLPTNNETTDEVVHIIEWRDGSLLDTIKKNA